MPKSGSDKPKRPKSAYNVFVSEARLKVIEEDPSIAKKQSVIMTKVAAMWKKLTEEEKIPYKEKAAAINAENGIEPKEKKKSSKKAKKDKEEEDDDDE
ncbi:nucleolar transcription factor 1 isoform X1 [Histomonas meleagridis]|uniref:nucleolar transcription factor 1 isoform X1 n=1 Tax=Histomonas meleagridis TaxID=135588 RepID=UPI00355AA6B4|nr:nucleolar transcription factor 1 isoform X1 [Histomonas meleagridis]KAH0804849.1 nucleolar transcription factor 1 isoform X1 [Histomonas meleagridis]